MSNELEKYTTKVTEEKVLPDFFKALNFDIDSIDKTKELTTLILDYKEREQLRIIQKDKADEELLRLKQERLLNMIKQITSILVGLILIVVGVIIFLNSQIETKDFGIFLITIGLVALGISSNILKSILELFRK